MIIYNIGSRVKKVNQKSKSKSQKKVKNMSEDTEKDEIIYKLLVALLLLLIPCQVVVVLKAKS